MRGQPLLQRARPLGWLPSSPYVPPEQLAEPNAVIDEAAGRSTSDIRRQNNITAPARSSCAARPRSGPSSSRSWRSPGAWARSSSWSIATATRTCAASPTRSPRLGVTPTPDDGTRLSGTTLWDESDRPTGPQRAGAGAFAGPPGRRRRGRFVTSHHSLEDASFFPQVRRADPRPGPVLDRLSEEHRVIHEVLDRVGAALVATVSDRKGITELGDAVDLLTDALPSRLSYEECELVEPLARLGIG